MSDDLPGQTVIFESAAAAAEGSMPLPNPTPGILEAREGAAPAPDQPSPSAGAGEAPKDNKGVPFDPAKHEQDPATGLGRLSKQGTWKLKRGNGSRAAAGKPMAGAMQGKLVLPASEASPAPADGKPAEPPPTGTIPPGAVVESIHTQVPPPPPVPLADYETTAVGVSHATWALFQMLGGPKWEPDKEEVGAWSKAWQRVWHHYQLPLVGPLIEVVILAGRAAAKRSDGSKARKWVAGAWRWVRGGTFAEPEPAPVRPS